MTQTIEQPEISDNEDKSMEATWEGTSDSNTEATWEGTTDDCRFAIYIDELFIYPSAKEFYTADLLPRLIDQVLNDCPLVYLEDIRVIYIEL